MKAQVKRMILPEVFWYWLLLSGITLALVMPSAGIGYGVAVCLTAIKTLCVSEHFMGLKKAGFCWRLPMALYGVLVPLLCVLIIVY